MAALVLLGSSSARAVGVYAGPDIVLAAPGATALAGSVTNLSPIDYWVGDGNNATENDFLHYNSQTGVSAVGPIQTPTGTIFGYPGDLQQIGSTVYGIDSYFGQLYTADLSTGIVTPYGPQRFNSYTSLAYDPTDSILYSFDSKNFFLHAINPATGNDVSSYREYIAGGGGTYLEHVQGLAFDPVNSLLYLSETDTGSIYVMDPATNPYSALYVTTPNASGPLGSSILGYTELQFYDGALYGTFFYTDSGGIQHAQLRRIDLATGQTVDIGSAIDDASIHALLIDSMPENVEWSVVSGPGTVNFADPSDPNTTATFSADGTYILRLSAIGNGGETFDTVNVFVPEPAEATLLVAGLLGLLASGRRRGAKRA